MFNAKIIPPTEQINRINDAYRQQPKLTATAMKRAGRGLKKRWLPKFKVEPRPAPRGITKFMTPPQRRLVHAKRRARGGGAYERTHELVNAWDITVEASDKGGAIILENDSSKAGFFYGVQRQRWIEVIGWLDPIPLMEAFEKEVIEVTDETLLTVTDPFAGVR